MVSKFYVFKEKISNLKIPSYIKNYFINIVGELEKFYTIAEMARKERLDPEESPEPLFVWDMAERIEYLVGPKGISKFIRENLKLSREELALKAIDYVIDRFFGIYPIQELAELSLRLALAILTEGMTVAPIEGIQKVVIKRGVQGPYLSIYFAGPIRAAGGTEAGLVIVYADYVRRRLGLAKYFPIKRPGENEVSRFIEELRIHEREIGNFQIKCSDEQIEFTLLNIPVEVTGPPTSNIEVIVNRDLPRIETNKLRGGALRVINDGLVGRARKISVIVERLGLNEWEWLKKLPDLGNMNEKYEDHKSHFIEDVIMGRPVISLENHKSSFRIRYGRGSNMGISAVGVHPAVFSLLDYFIVIGTQVKVDYPGKGAIVVPSSKAEPPIVELKDGSVIRVADPKIIDKIRDDIIKILWLGDIIISFGDILENNRKLRPSPYTVEWWISDLKRKLRLSDSMKEELLLKLINNNRNIELEDALEVSRKYDVFLHPRYVLRWNRLQISEFIDLMERLQVINKTENSIEIPHDPQIIKYLKNMLVPFKIKDNILIIEDAEAKILNYLSKQYKQYKPISTTDIDTTEKLISTLLKVRIPNIEGSGLNVRLGRPEKAAPRKLKPPVHVLFPVENYGGNMRDIIKMYKEYHRVILELSVRSCPKCEDIIPHVFCPKCKVKTHQLYYCSRCKILNDKKICRKCGNMSVPYRKYTLDIKEYLSKYFSEAGFTPEKLKGVRTLMNENRIPEYLAKGILRALHNVYIFKDGTCRVDITNAPLLRFRPKDIGISYKLLKKLGYDVNSDDEWVNILPQDVIIPRNIAEYLVNIANFIDDSLTKIYKFKRGAYNIKRIKDLVGHLVIGLSPHTSAGVIGRIIGFTEAQVLYAHPLWHAAKRRDCDGDQDSIMLLLDVLINFSRHYLPAGPGGRMDAPLFINIIIIPEEVDTQPHNMDVMSNYPVEFYEATLTQLSSKDIVHYMDIMNNYLWGERKYGPFDSTEDPPCLQLDVNKSTYSRLSSMKKKVNYQLKLMDLIFDENMKIWLVKAILNKHIFPDIIGNLRAFSTQSYRCKNCNRPYRRPPLRGICEACGGELIQSLHPRSIIKYLAVAKELISGLPLDRYIKERLKLLEKEIFLTVKISEEKYKRLTGFIN